MKRILSLITALLCVNLANAFEVDFTKDDAERLFGDASKKLHMISDGAVVISTRIESKPIAVKPGRKYKLQMMARVDSHFVVEENDRAHIETLQSHAHNLASTYGVSFFSPDGDSVPPLGGNTRLGASSGGFFLTRNLYPYVRIFYVPEGATSLKVTFEPRKWATYLTSLELVEETAEETVNVDPDFRYGELNYNGWRPAREGRLYERPDGKVVLHTGYTGSSAFFPVTPEGRYHVRAVGESGNQFNIEYYDQEGKSLARRTLLRPTPEGVETEFVPPEGTIMARLTTVRAVLLHGLWIRKVE